MEYLVVSLCYVPNLYHLFHDRWFNKFVEECTEVGPDHRKCKTHIGALNSLSMAENNTLFPSRKNVRLSPSV